MGKDTEIRFVGQPIFKQIISLIDAVNIQGLVQKHNIEKQNACYNYALWDIEPM